MIKEILIGTISLYLLVNVLMWIKAFGVSGRYKVGLWLFPTQIKGELTK